MRHVDVGDGNFRVKKFCFDDNAISQAIAVPSDDTFRWRRRGTWIWVYATNEEDEDVE